VVAVTALGIAVSVVIGVVVEVTIMIKSLKLMLLLRETVIWFHS
jgi:ACR3 family arsenite efflux pump ArsB